MTKDTKIMVENRDNGTVGYRIPDLNNLRREFAPNEKKEIAFDELQRLSYQSGGRYILENCLIIEDEKVANELLGEVEPEYFYTKDDIKELLLTGSLDQLEDCLNFAPKGVIDLVKEVAVAIEVPDLQKRQLIQDKTGFNINKAVTLKSEPIAEQETKTTKRKAKPIKDKKERKAEPSKKDDK